MSHDLQTHSDIAHNRSEYNSESDEPKTLLEIGNNNVVSHSSLSHPQINLRITATNSHLNAHHMQTYDPHSSMEEPVYHYHIKTEYMSSYGQTDEQKLQHQQLSSNSTWKERAMQIERGW
jgi:hypothetical protein